MRAPELPVTNRYYDPTRDQQTIYRQADGQDRLDSPCPQRGRTTAHYPNLVRQPSYRHCKEKRLQALEPNQTRTKK